MHHVLFQGDINEMVKIKKFNTEDDMNRFLKKQNDDRWQIRFKGSKLPLKSGTYYNIAGSWQKL